MKNILSKLDLFFPEQTIFARQWTRIQTIVLFGVFATGFYLVALFIPARGFIAFDWVHVFAPGKIQPFPVPWTQYGSYQTWPLFVGLSMAGITLATLKRSVHVLSTVAVLFSPPVYLDDFPRTA